MSTQITGTRWGTDARDNTTAQTHIAADPTGQRTQDSMAQLVRQGQDTSLRSLQVWADLARNFGSSQAGAVAGSTMLSLAHDPFQKLLMAQRQIVDELVATQCELARQLADSPAAQSGHSVRG